MDLPDPIPPVRPTTSISRRPYHRPIRPDPRLFSPRAAERLVAARSQNRRARKALEDGAADWPDNSPGSLVAWLLLATTKPPVWRDPLILWDEHPLTLGRPHPNFFYPDPLGFWAEVRRWSVELVRLEAPELAPSDALALTTLLHVGGDAARLARAMALFSPRVVLFLDEPSWTLAGLDVRRTPHYIDDPHRAKQAYEGFWGRTADGLVVGKAPQHPTTHNLYRWEDMAAFLRSAPLAGDGG